jgi:hypothetical protein
VPSCINCRLISINFNITSGIPGSPISVDRLLFVPFVDFLATIADFGGEARSRLSTSLWKFVGENIFEVASEARGVELPVGLDTPSSERGIGQTAGVGAAASLGVLIAVTEK